MDEIDTQVTETIETMTQAFNRKDIHGIMESYEEGAVVMFEAAQKITGTQRIQHMFEGAFQANPKFSYPKGHEVYASNDLALHIAPWTMEASAPDGSRITQEGLSVAVLRKQHNGQWLLVLDNPHGQRLLIDE